MQNKTGILLAAGTGSRLLPLTLTMNKHMVPVYNRHMIEYPLDTLIELGCTNVTIVIGGDQTGFGQVVSYLKDGAHLGLKINYVYQPRPTGIAHAINLCQDYIKADRFYVILGDNVFEKTARFTNTAPRAQIVLSSNSDIHRFGVASILNGYVQKIEEKPKVLDESMDNFAITGLYLFDQKYFEYFTDLEMSARGEYEITDIIRKYHSNKELYYVMSNGWWSDTGTFESLHHVSNMIREKIMAERPKLKLFL